MFPGNPKRNLSWDQNAQFRHNGFPRSWFCTLCKDWFTDSFEEHSIGERHRANHDLLLWTCDFCDVSVLGISKALHDAGKGHQDTVSAFWRSQSCGKPPEIPAPTPPPSTWTFTPPAAATSQPQVIPQYTQNHHSTVQRPPNYGTNYATTTPGTQKYRINSETPANTKGNENTQTTPISNPGVLKKDPISSSIASLPTALASPHRTSSSTICTTTRSVLIKEIPKPESKATEKLRKQPWTCEICNVTTTDAFRVSHLIGRRHRSRSKGHVNLQEGVSIVFPTAINPSATPVVEGMVNMGDAGISNNAPKLQSDYYPRQRQPAMLALKKEQKQKNIGPTSTVGRISKAEILSETQITTPPTTIVESITPISEATISPREKTRVIRTTQESEIPIYPPQTLSDVYALRKKKKRRQPIDQTGNLWKVSGATSKTQLPTAIEPSTPTAETTLNIGEKAGSDSCFMVRLPSYIHNSKKRKGKNSKTTPINRTNIEPDHWTCSYCNITIDIYYRPWHVGGDPHKEMVAKSQDTKTQPLLKIVDVSVVPTTPKSVSQETPVQFPKPLTPLARKHKIIIPKPRKPSRNKKAEVIAPKPTPKCMTCGALDPTERDSINQPQCINCYIHEQESMASYDEWVSYWEPPEEEDNKSVESSQIQLRDTQISLINRARLIKIDQMIVHQLARKKILYHRHTWKTYAESEWNPRRDGSRGGRAKDRQQSLFKSRDAKSYFTQGYFDDGSEEIVLKKSKELPKKEEVAENKVIIGVTVPEFENTAIDQLRSRDTVVEDVECDAIRDLENRPTEVDIKQTKITRPLSNDRGSGGHFPVAFTERLDECWLCMFKIVRGLKVGNGDGDGYPNRTEWRCSACELPLCLSASRNCFTEFHRM